MTKNGDSLMLAFDQAVRDGEVSYQANRRAARNIDIFADDEEGLQDLIVMSEGLDVFMLRLEELQNVADEVAEQARASLR